ncbi:lamin tail domain-containing protein [Nocardioides marmorisolisilvae]|uniref:LTD domain-containing protein n=1 Tax=Nocardioides marmorisolisilvae TaxID=1542737 RepID=A0A3N0E0I8_9ACTN|nr:lamin tail domain-containing protein [Nocardioides marmorisolisilvae]RNL81369.1 hypothetical protein EFL95_03215 [Nocardioides marmorisolisilvae]
MHVARTRNVLTALIGLLAVLAAGLVLAAPASAADSDIRINEVSSNPNDFVELINTGLAPIDINGWKFADSDHAPIPIVTTSTVIQPGARFSFDPNALTGGFGLGATDAANVFNASGTAIDSDNWTSHRTPSYGRCPEGTGPQVLQTAATPGAANACGGPSPSAIKINEVSSNPNDFVELINTGSAAIDLLGWTFADSDHSPIAIVSASTLIQPGGYYTFDPNTLPGGFGLGSADAATIRSGTTLVDTYSWTTHRTPSYGRCPNGSGDFVANTSTTQNAANACPAPALPSVVINEVESNGDAIGDWVELKNTGTTAVNISGWKVLDNDPAHAANPEVVPANTTLQPGGYYSIYTEFTPAPGFGLGTADSANLYLPDGTTLVDTYSWTAHAATTYGRCPDGTGPFVTTTTPTRNAGNACSPIRINEIESDQGVPGDWVELKNISGASVDISGWVFKDNQDADIYTVPTGTSIAGGGYYVLNVADFVFGLGSSDSARLYDNSAKLIDSYTWTAHATQTYGRCKDGLGNFVDTKAPTKGAANSCPGLDTQPWPGGPTVTTADNTDTFVQDLSGLVFDPSNPDVLWGAQNKKGTLFKLVRDANNNWVPADGWPRDPKFLGGTGSPDTEGLTIGPDGFVYETSERDNDNSGVSRNTILRFDPNAPAGPTISPTTEWDLNSFLPTVGANLGLEGVTFVPDSYLVASGFKDQSTGQAYDPANYPLHGSGLFFVAVEADGSLVGFALDSDGTPHKIATVASGLAQLADVDWDPELNRLRAVADDTWDGTTILLNVDGSGNFVPVAAYDRPAGMPNLNNEGLAVAPQSRCVSGKKEVL